MKKITLLSLFFAFCCTNLKAQDLIITDAGDSLNCNITKIRTDYIQFAFMQDKEVRHTLLPIEKVKQYLKGFYKVSLVPLDMVKQPDNYQKFRIGINGGYSYRTAKVNSSLSPTLAQFIKGLKSGYHLGIDAGYFWSPNVGVGFRYNGFRSQNQVDNVSFTQGNQTTSGSLRGNVNIDYAAPVLYTRLTSANKKTAFFSNLSLGYMGYKEVETGVLNLTSTGSTFGMGLDLGVDFMLNKKLALGLNAGYLNGALTQLEMDYGTHKETLKLEAGQYESLARLDFGIGLRWVW